MDSRSRGLAVLAVVAAVCFAAGAGVGFVAGRSAPRAVEANLADDAKAAAPAEPLRKVEAGQIEKAYFNNVAEADSAYLGKTIQLAAHVGAPKKRDSGSGYEMLVYPKGTLAPWIVGPDNVFFLVYATFTDEQARQCGKIREGDHVTMIGKVVNTSDVGYDPIPFHAGIRADRAVIIRFQIESLPEHTPKDEWWKKNPPGQK